MAKSTKNPGLPSMAVRHLSEQPDQGNLHKIFVTGVVY